MCSQGNPYLTRKHRTGRDVGVRANSTIMVNYRTRVYDAVNADTASRLD
jgi:hypothetical protein